MPSTSVRANFPWWPANTVADPSATGELVFLGTVVYFTGVLRARGIRISMDSKGRCIDNVFIERLWRSLKYENVYLMAYAGPWEARDGIGRYFDYFNEERSHQALANRTPMEVYRESVLVEQRRAA